MPNPSFDSEEFAKAFAAMAPVVQKVNGSFTWEFPPLTADPKFAFSLTLPCPPLYASLLHRVAEEESHKLRETLRHKLTFGAFHNEQLHSLLRADRREQANAKARRMADRLPNYRLLDSG